MLTLIIQWGSEIWTSLDFRWSKRSWVENGWDFKWDQEPNHLKSVKVAAILSNILKYRHKRLDFEWSGFQMVGTIAIYVTTLPIL